MWEPVIVAASITFCIASVILAVRRHLHLMDMRSQIDKITYRSE